MEKKKISKKYYVYKIEDPETCEFYIGSRMCNCNPIYDTYMGSYKRWKPKFPNRLIKTILKSNFRKRETCIRYESNLIKQNIDNELNRNYHIPNIGFICKGHTDITKRKISESSKGISKPIPNIETRKKMSKTRIERKLAVGENNGMYGKTHSDESKKKMGVNLGRKFDSKVRHAMSIARIGLKRTDSQKYNATFTNCCKVVLQLDEFGIVINEWRSIKAAARELGLHPSAISMCCIGKRKTHGGFKWKLKNEN
jgi:hypothetical protein